MHSTGVTRPARPGPGLGTGAECSLEGSEPATGRLSHRVEEAGTEGFRSPTPFLQRTPNSLGRRLYSHRNGIFGKNELVRSRVPRTPVSHGFMSNGAYLLVDGPPIDSPPQ